jgi:hypothetical protein
LDSKEYFASLLDETAEILKPLIVSAPVGALVWNGKEYAPTDVEQVADSTATKWWGILKTMAGLLKAQSSPLSTEQIKYIKRALFGGMGSFQDLTFDKRRTHGLPNDTNARLADAVEKLWGSFTTLDTWT